MNSRQMYFVKRRVLSIAFASVVVGGGCVTPQPDPYSDTTVDYIAVEMTVTDDDLSFWDVPPLGSPVMHTAPADRSDGLPVGELGTDGDDREMIVAFAEELFSGQHGDYDSLLIAHKDKLVFESYSLRGRINLTHPQVSATKAYTALALGRAIQLGYLTMADLDKPIVSLIDGIASPSFVAGTDTITLHHALTMMSGLRFTDEQKEAFNDDAEGWVGQEKLIAYLTESAPVSPESQVFEYQGADPTLVMHVIDAVVPSTAAAFIEEEVLDKLGISAYSWQRDASGLPRSGDRASITSRDMAKFGLLVLNDGQWNGAQLIPKDFIAKLASSAVTLSDEDAFFASHTVTNAGYGYFWWQADLVSGGKSYRSSSAQGGGGQYVVVIDELDLVVVVTAHGEESSVLQLMPEKLLPAFPL